MAYSLSCHCKMEYILIHTLLFLNFFRILLSISACINIINLLDELLSPNVTFFNGPNEPFYIGSNRPL